MTHQRVSEADVAHILSLIADPPNLRARPQTGDLSGDYDRWFDGGAIRYITGSTQYVFADGKWTRNDTYEGTCSTDGVPFHAAVTAEFVLPEPPQDPITQFTVHGHQTIVSAGHNCGSTNFEENWVRTGD